MCTDVQWFRLFFNVFTIHLLQQCTHIEQLYNIVLIMYINYLAATDYIDPSVFFGLAIIPVLTD